MVAAVAKRFYQDVSIQVLEDGSGFSVLLDGRPLKTPGKSLLVVNSRHLAQLIAQEWDEQVQTIKPETMPVTRLVNVSIELTPLNRDKLTSEARSYASTDLLCYRAGEELRLIERQKLQWDPVLIWAKGQGMSFVTTESIQAVEQDPSALDTVRDKAASMGDVDLTLLLHLTATYGSVILALAVIEGELMALDAFELSRLEEIYQIERWGEDEEAQARTSFIREEIKRLAQIIEGKDLG